MTGRLALAAVLLALALPAVGCSSSSTGAGGSSGGPGTADVVVPPQYSAPAAGLHTAELEVGAAATHLTVRSTGDGAQADLFQAGVAGSGSPTLRVDTTANRVRILTGSPGRGDTSLAISLNPLVRWSIRLSGGATTLVLELSRLRISGLEIAGGASSMDVHLPRPEGKIPVIVSGGASTLRFSAPPGVPVEVTITGGVSRATVDGQTVEAPEQGRRIDSAGYPVAAAGYDIGLRAGASSFVLTRR
ncbi:MAG: hypothetical protein NVSMB29_13730 [Candidatus Dormibacteria bacterium]